MLSQELQEGLLLTALCQLKACLACVKCNSMLHLLWSNFLPPNQKKSAGSDMLYMSGNLTWLDPLFIKADAVMRMYVDTHIRRSTHTSFNTILKIDSSESFMKLFDQPFMVHHLNSKCGALYID